MLPDVNKYMRYLDGLDISSEEKAEIIRALWTILEKLVDRALEGGLDPVQCGSKSAPPSSLVLHFAEKTRHRYGLVDRAAKPSKRKAKEGSGQ